MAPRDEFIVEVWERMGAEVVGASELGVVADAVVKRFGSAIPPAPFARGLPDNGARLGHPEILQADARWRENQSLFTADGLEFGNLEAARKLIAKMQQLENDPA